MQNVLKHALSTMLFLILYRRQVVEGVTECTLDQGERPKGNYLPPVQYYE